MKSMIVLAVLSIVATHSGKAEGEENGANYSLCSSGTYNSKPDYRSQDSLIHYAECGDSFASNVMLNEINTRAFRRFRRDYPFASKETWIKSKEGFSVIFTSDDSIVRHVYYSPAGRFLETFIFYPEKNIPRTLNDCLKNSYKDYSILFANGMDDGIKMIFQVTFADKRVVRTVEVSDDDIKTVNEFEK